MKANIKFHIRFNKVVLLPLLLLLLYPATGFSLDNDVWNTGLNFRFYPPGARALGMGGAFVGLADDATAAASNPAGIAQLNRMQLAIEGRYISVDKNDNSFAGAGNIFGLTSEEDDITEVSFGAFSTPLFDNFLNLCVFYDKPMSFSVKKRLLIAGPAAGTQTATNDISINEAGMSIAKSFAGDRLMLGAGIGVQFFDIETRELFIRGDGTFGFSGRVDESDADLSYRVGILVKPIDNLRLGASYTMMPEFDTELKFLTPNGTLNLDSAFNVPDNLSMGAAYNIFPNWAVIFEARYILYSQLMDGFVVDTTYPGDNGVLAPESDFSIDDIWEIHFGTEYVLNVIQNIPIAIRAGLFYEPAHDLEFSGANTVQRNLFDGGDDLMHYTVGTGAVFFNHFQVDIGADFTEESRNVTLSMVYQF